MQIHKSVSDPPKYCLLLLENLHVNKSMEFIFYRFK